MKTYECAKRCENAGNVIKRDTAQFLIFQWENGKISMDKWQNIFILNLFRMCYNHLVSPAFRDNPLSHIGFCGFALALLFCRRKSCKACLMIWSSQSIVNHYGEGQRIGQIIQEYPNMLLTLTWCHRHPADTPTRPCLTAISTEHQLDNVACAYYVGRQGGAAALLHQGCPVPVRDCQVVVGTGGMGFNVKCSEL